MENPLKKGIYAIPTLFTMFNLALGFYAIVSIFNGKFSNAAWAIVASHFCDALDGKIARLTNTCSSFGVEFDSFADWISFGIAPALMMYQLVLFKYGKLGFAIALFFVITGALRLARYNIKEFEGTEVGKTYFVGLPIPGAGGMLAAFVLVYEMFYQEITHKTIPLVMNNIPVMYKFMPIIMFILALSMVSRIRWNNFRKVKVQRPKPFRALIVALVFFLMLYTYTENVIFLIYIYYFFWGVTGSIVERVKNFKKRGEDVGSKQSYSI